MDLTGTIAYNGTTATTPTPVAGDSVLDGYLCESANISEIDVSQYLDKRSVKDGLDAADVYLGGRRVRLIYSVLGSTKGRAWDNLTALEAAFSPVLAYNADSANLGFLALDYYRPTANISTWPTSAYPHGIPMRLYARPLAPPRWDVSRITTGGASAKGAGFRVELNLICRDPRQYLQSLTQVTMTSNTATATYRGNYPTLPIITFLVTAAGSTATTRLGIGSQYVPLILSNASTAGSPYTIDFSTGQITDANGALANSLFATSDTISFPPVQSGSTYWVSGSFTGLGTRTLKYREAFT